MRDALKGSSLDSITPVVSLPAGFAIAKVMRPAKWRHRAVARERAALAKSAEGNIQFDFDISGIKKPRPRWCNCRSPPGGISTQRGLRIQEGIAGSATQSIETLEDPNAGGPNAHRRHVAAVASLGQYHIFFGEADKAMEQWEIAYRMAEKDLPRMCPMWIAAGNRLSAKGGDGQRRVPPSGRPLYFPHRPGSNSPSLKTPTRRSNSSREFQAKPDDLEVRWLLNLAHMSGSYPGGVPKKY